MNTKIYTINQLYYTYEKFRYILDVPIKDKFNGLPIVGLVDC